MIWSTVVATLKYHYRNMWSPLAWPLIPLKMPGIFYCSVHCVCSCGVQRVVEQPSVLTSFGTYLLCTKADVRKLKNSWTIVEIFEWRAWYCHPNWEGFGEELRAMVTYYGDHFIIGVFKTLNNRWNIKTILMHFYDYTFEIEMFFLSEGRSRIWESWIQGWILKEKWIIRQIDKFHCQ